jgi:hypothetical protein
MEIHDEGTGVIDGVVSDTAETMAWGAMHGTLRRSVLFTGAQNRTKEKQRGGEGKVEPVAATGRRWALCPKMGIPLQAGNIDHREEG